MSSELVAILEKESAAERERIIGEARAKANELTTQATREAQQFLEEQRRRLEGEQTAAKTKTESAAQLQASSLVLQAKDQAITDIFQRAEGELGRITQNKSQYGKILRGLIREGAGALSGRVVVEVHPDDLEMARAVVRELGLDAELKAAPEIAGGALLATRDGRFVVENTLRSRLERTKPLLASEIATVLWG